MPFHVDRCDTCRVGFGEYIAISASEATPNGVLFCAGCASVTAAELDEFEFSVPVELAAAAHELARVLCCEVGMSPAEAALRVRVIRHELARLDRCAACGTAHRDHPAGDGLTECPGDFDHTSEALTRALVVMREALR